MCITLLLVHYKVIYNVSKVTVISSICLFSPKYNDIHLTVKEKLRYWKPENVWYFAWKKYYNDGLLIQLSCFWLTNQSNSSSACSTRNLIIMFPHTSLHNQNCFISYKNIKYQFPYNKNF